MTEPQPPRNGAPAPLSGAEVLRASPTPALLLGPELQIAAANPALARLLGHDPSAALHGPADRLVVAGERTAVRDLLRGPRDPTVALEQHLVTMLRADGLTVRTRWSVAGIGGAGELLVHVEAVREERQLRPNLPASDGVPAEFLLRVFDTVPDPALLYFEADKTILDANGPWCASTGYDRDEVRGARIDRLDIWHDPADRAAVHERLLRHGRVHDLPMRFRRRGDGAVREAIVSAAIMREQGREVVLAVARDVTARREVDERQRHAQRLEVLGRLASSVAHDYNNVLGVIAGYAQELRRSLEPDDARQEDVVEILQAIRRGAGLTRQLLTFGRRSVQAPRVLDLNVVVEELRPMLARLGGPTIRLRVVRAPSPALVLADPTGIQQVLMNLATNACDAMPGGGRLVVALSHAPGRRPPADAGAEDAPRSAHVCLAVRDSGTGMDERTRARLFEPYFTTKEEGRGTGLGLATVYGIVTQGGGRIDVDSAPGRGTTFRIHLPAVSEGGGAAREPAPR